MDGSKSNKPPNYVDDLESLLIRRQRKQSLGLKVVVANLEEQESSEDLSKEEELEEAIPLEVDKSSSGKEEEEEEPAMGDSPQWAMIEHMKPNLNNLVVTEFENHATPFELERYMGVVGQ